jgi:hypothetical protein
MTRRQLFAAVAATAVPARASVPSIDADVVRRHDGSVEQTLAKQNNDPQSPWPGAAPDADGLYHAGSAGAILNDLTAAFVCPQSRYYNDRALVERIKKAAGFLERGQSADGNISLITTNFNSPPDTGFVVHNVAAAASIARLYGDADLLAITRRFLERAGQGMTKGGLHTPNHRWVVSSALAQIHDLYPDPRYLRRIDQWLAEGIDIDADGQYQERSTLVYNVVSNRAFVVLAEKLNRPALLDPVRRNLASMMYLLHGDDEVVTEISRRQDQHTRGNIGGYWFALRYMAAKDGNGQFATLARRYHDRASLSAMLEYPMLRAALPSDAALPDNFEKEFPTLGIVRIKRGPLSATIARGNDRFFTLRRGPVVITAVRFASAFFGKGQFVPATSKRTEQGWLLEQKMEAGYQQPVAHAVSPDGWGATRNERKVTELCRLEQSAEIRETKNGFMLRVRANGTDGVPLAIEIGLRDVQPRGATQLHPDAWVLEKGFAELQAGRDTMRVGPGTAPHRYVKVRGAYPTLEGPGLFITGYTPFDHTLRFEWD